MDALLAESSRSQAESNYDSCMKRMHVMDEEKARRLQQIASITHAQHSNNAAIEEFTKRRNETWGDVMQNRKTVAELVEAVRVLQKRADDNDVQHTEMVHATKELEQRQEMNRKALESAIQRTNDSLGSQISTNRENIAREHADMIDMFRSREKKINQTMENAVGEEANERIAVANNVANLEQSLKDLRASLADEASKLKVSIQSLHTKTTTSVSDLNDLIASDRNDRDRLLKGSKTDYVQRVADLREIMDAKCVEMIKDSKAADNQLAAILDSLRKDMLKNLQKQQDLLDEDKKLHAERVLDLQQRFDNMMVEAKKNIEASSQDTVNKLAALKADLLLETKLRTQDKDRILEELAQECMRREKDEAAIINTLDHLMRQIKQMNTH